MFIFSSNLIRAAKTENLLPESNLIEFENIPSPGYFKNIYLKKSFLYNIYGKLYETTSFTKKKSSSDSLFEQILFFINENYADECDLYTVSEKLKYDYSYLSKFFKKKTGLTFTNYVNLYRINQACAIFQNEEMQISETAMRVGYDTLRTFNYEFKKIKGMTPSEFIEKQKG